MRGFAQPLLESGHRGVAWEAGGSAGEAAARGSVTGGSVTGEAAAEDVAAGGGAAGETTASSSKIKIKRAVGSESGWQQKRTLEAPWDIQLGDLPLNAGLVLARVFTG